MARSSDFQVKRAMNIDRPILAIQIYRHTELVMHICSDLYVQSLPTGGKTMELSTEASHCPMFLYKETHVLKECVFWVGKMSDMAGICPLAAVLNTNSSLPPE
jgi:hypothetical protein